MSYEAAIPVAYLIGMGVAYVLNRALVFAPSGRAISDEWVRFSIVNLIAAGQVWIVSVGLARVVFPAIGFGFHTETTAHVIGVLSPVFTSYIGHKHITFRPKRGSAG
jgi:putative flippase GtrA